MKLAIATSGLPTICVLSALFFIYGFHALLGGMAALACGFVAGFCVRETAA